MKDRNRDIIVKFLAKYGIADEQTTSKVVGGFDLARPVFERLLEKGERLFQFIRNVELGNPCPLTGNWFCLAGATMDAVGIFSGGAGRRLVEFTVNRPVWSLEGTAGPIERSWAWAGGGSGGATQIYLPCPALFALTGKGTHSRGVG